MLAVFGLGLHHHLGTREATLREAIEQPVRKTLGHERDRVHAIRGRIQLGTLLEVRRRSGESGRVCVFTARESVRSQTIAAKPCEH